jgi:hypothetical protein
MLLDELEFDGFTERVGHSPWGQGNSTTARRLFLDSERGLFVKVWEPEYQHASSYWRGRKLAASGMRGLFGYAIGFFNSEIGGAFIDFIEDRAGNCRGYVTRAGTPLLTGRGDPRFQAFLESVKRATLETGYAHTDFCHNNLVLVENRISFIDFDTLFTDLKHAEVDFEKEKGALRPHVYQEYREFVGAMLT